MGLKTLWTSKLAIGGLLLLCLALGNLKYRQWQNQKAIDEERESLKHQIDSLTKKNQDLSSSLSYLGTETFKQQTARQQLNLKREGEIVFGFTDQVQNQSPEGGGGSQTPNYEKWINYFFGTD